MNDSLQIWDSVDCDGCEIGIADREAIDYDPDIGPSFEPRNGSSHPDRYVWLCTGCTAIELAFVAEYGCSIRLIDPPRSERDYRLAFELERAA